MDIQVNKYKKLQRQKVSLKKGINLLVGTNGSGKSSFLEYLFKGNIPLKNKVCFSSGINESFSTIFNEITKKNFRELKKRGDFEFDSEVLFFDKPWVPWLILFASYRAPRGMVNNYLIKTNKKIHNFRYRFKLPKSYIDRITNELEAGEANLEENYLINSRIHQFLNEFVPKFFDIESYEGKGVRYRGDLIQDSMKERLEEGARDFYLDSEEIDTLNPNITNYFDKRQVFKGDIFSIFSYLTVAMLGPKNSQYIDIESTQLIFHNLDGVEIDLNSLSDGEHQLLSIFSLIDLFGNTNTLFLLDELDSHIHPTNLNLIWKVLGRSNDYIVTSSHNIMSIANSKLNTIKFLENGQIVNENKKKSRILESIHGIYYAEKISLELLLSTPNLIIMDGHDDWTILLELFKRMKLNTNEIEKKYICYPVSSDFKKGSPKTEIAKAKYKWLETLMDYISKQKVPKERIILKNIFFICDRDDFPYDDNCLKNDRHKVVYDKKKTKKANGIQFSWKTIILNRREIENYLLSKNAFVNNDFSDYSIDNVLERLQLKFNASNKSKDLDYYKNYVGKGQYGTVHLDSLENQKICEDIDCKDRVSLSIRDSNGLNLEKLSNHIGNMEQHEFDNYLNLLHSELSSTL